MKSKLAWQSLLVSAVLLAGIFAVIHFWPRHAPWGASAASTPTNATKMTYLPRTSEELTRLAAAQPAFGVLASRMRVNLADITVLPDGSVSGSEVELKNRTDDELRWLIVNPNSDDEAFQFPGTLDSVIDSSGVCHRHAPVEPGQHVCGPASLTEFVSRGSYTFYAPVNSLEKGYFCTPKMFADPDPVCMRSTLSYRLTIDNNGAIRIYSAGSIYEEGLADKLYSRLKDAIIGMSVDWRAKLHYPNNTLECQTTPSCSNTGYFSYKANKASSAAMLWPTSLGFTASEVDPDHLSMAYVEGTPVFANWGGDQFERCLESSYDLTHRSDPAIPVIPSQSTNIETTGCTQLFPQYLLAHPDWFHEHPIWAIRFTVAGDHVPTGPITQADVDRYSEKPEWQILKEKKSSP